MPAGRLETIDSSRLPAFRNSGSVIAPQASFPYRRALSLGAQRFIPKPYRFDGLVDEIRSVYRECCPNGCGQIVRSAQQNGNGSSPDCVRLVATLGCSSNATNVPTEAAPILRHSRGG